MSPIAAYYLMIANEHEREREARRPRLTAAPEPTASLAERIAAGLQALVRLGRPSSVQPA